ncbi:MAG TPA: CHAD domain-containing protein [Acidimicrobiales bacterium]|nr:CHAD domain-containing protein [Acidimicrobiales bacterium]
MDFALRADEPVAAGLRRIARAEVEAALADVDQPEDRGIEESVHDLRKRCKQLRAVARIVRPHLGRAYAPTNAAFRDAARQLSAVRDTQVLVEVLDGLVSGGLAGDAAAPVQEVLAARHRTVTDSLAADPAPFDRARSLLEVGWRHVEGWDLADGSGFDLLAGGIRRSYAGARRAARRCRDEATTEDLHEWRKRTKDHWYHLRLLHGSAPALLEPWIEQVHALSDALGDDHDLAVLAGTLQADPLGHGGDAVVGAVRRAVEVRRAELQERAGRLGGRVTAEHPDAVVDRLRLWWDAWHREGAP